MKLLASVSSALVMSLGGFTLAEAHMGGSSTATGAVLKTASKAPPKARFDLVCTAPPIQTLNGTRLPDAKWLYTVDLNKGRWCEADCHTVYNLSVESGRVILYAYRAARGSVSMSTIFDPASMKVLHADGGSDGVHHWSTSCVYRKFSTIKERPSSY